MKEIRILVVEDEIEWNEKLVEMYRKLFGSIKPPVRYSVESTRKGQEAINLLRQKRYDLLSLDINLGSTHPTTADGSLDRTYGGVDGRDLIELAKTTGCHGLIVISGFAHDDTVIKLYEFDAENERRADEDIIKEVRRERVRLGSQIAKEWGERQKFFSKDESMDIDLTVEAISQELTPDVLRQLCRPENKFTRNPSNPAVWDIVLDGIKFTVTDRAGMHHIAQLLNEPHRKFSGVDLEQIDPRLLPGESSDVKVDDESGTAASMVREIDEEIAKLQERAQDIEESIRAAKDVGVDATYYLPELEEIVSLIEESGKQKSELLQETGRQRSQGKTPIEQANDRVGRNIDYCRKVIKKEEEKSCRERKTKVSTPVYDHMKKFIKRENGMFSYEPDSDTDWEITEPFVPSENYSRSRIKDDSQ